MEELDYEEKFNFRLKHITSPAISQEIADHSMSLQQTYPRLVHTATYHFIWDTLDEHKLQHITSPGINCRPQHITSTKISQANTHCNISLHLGYYE